MNWLSQSIHVKYLFRKSNAIKKLRWSVREFERSFYKCEIFNERPTHTWESCCPIRRQMIIIFFHFLLIREHICLFTFNSISKRNGGSPESLSHSIQLYIELRNYLISVISHKSHITKILNNSREFFHIQHKLPDLVRSKRGSLTGQTQSQYLSFGEKEDGKAEAEATKVE